MSDILVGSGERGAGSGERGAGSGERGAGSGERGAGSGERGAGSGERAVFMLCLSPPGLSPPARGLFTSGKVGGGLASVLRVPNVRGHEESSCGGCAGRA